MDLLGASLCVSICIWFGREYNRTFRNRRTHYLLGQKWYYVAGDCVLGKPCRDSNGGGMAAGKGAGGKICDSGLGILE